MIDKVAVYYTLCFLIGIAGGNYALATKKPFWKVIPLLILVNLTMFLIMFSEGK